MNASRCDVPRLALVGCGILRKEIDTLVAKNGWQLERTYLTSALHNDLGALSTALDSALTSCEAKQVKTIVVYGACHPQMHAILERHGTIRTAGQNCIAQLLGYDRFMAELTDGAYFLLEDWALTWAPMITATFGPKLPVIREIFRSSHKMIVAIRTPCSDDFKGAAEDAARFVDLPLRWIDADLDHLETILADARTRTLSPCGA